MAHGGRSLVALNDALEIDVPDDAGGVVGVQYGAFGADGTTAATGTVVVEGSINGVEWYARKIIKNDDTIVDNLAAAALAHVKMYGAPRVRARMSVAGGAQGVQVQLNTQAT